MTAAHRRSFGVSQFTTKPWTFEEDVRRLTRLFVDAIEIVEDELDDERFADQIGEVRRAGLAVSGLQPTVRTFYASRMTPFPPAWSNVRHACAGASSVSDRSCPASRSW